MATGFADQSKDKLKREISIKALLKYFDIEVNENSKCLCPFHEDNNPSMLVNDESVHCFAGCGGFDIYAFVQRYFELETFKDAFAWVLEHQEELPESEFSGSPRKRGEYRGPVQLDLVEYYHSCLTPALRNILHTKRLLTDKTIDSYKIGWRPDHCAFSLPFWSGEPGKSEVVIVQFRLTEDTPPEVAERFGGSKFVGLSGHNKPYLINKHLLTQDWAIMVFGTFDGLLAAQDGFIATSPNGASVYTQKKWAGELQEHLKTIKRLYIVYDKTASERQPVNKMLTHITCEKILCEFPEGPWKDYGDYRSAGKTSADFMREVLNWGLS